MKKDNVIICRCEDISLDEIHELMEQGHTSFEDMKRLLRVGMGACQGNTCGGLIQREIALFLNKKVEEINVHKVRPLITGVPLEAIAKGDQDES